MSESTTHPTEQVCTKVLRELHEIAPRKSLDKGRLIGVQGQPAETLYVLSHGHVLLSRADGQEKDYALYLLGPGQMFGEGSLHPDAVWMVSACAVTDGSVYTLPSSQLPRLFQHYPELARHILNLMSIRLDRAHRRLDVMHVESARERLLRFLHVLAHHDGEPVGDDIWMPLYLTQAEVGDMIGLARETVARELRALSAAGLIRREGRRGLWLRVAGSRKSKPCLFEQTPTSPIRR